MSLGGHFQPPHGPAAKIKETLGCILNEIENHWKVSNDMSCLVFLKRLLCCRDSVEKQDGSAVSPKVHLWKWTFTDISLLRSFHIVQEKLSSSCQSVYPLTPHLTAVIMWCVSFHILFCLLTSFMYKSKLFVLQSLHTVCRLLCVQLHDAFLTRLGGRCPSARACSAHIATRTVSQCSTDGHWEGDQCPLFSRLPGEILGKHACLPEGMFPWDGCNSIKGMWCFCTTVGPWQTGCLPTCNRSVWECLFPLNEIIELSYGLC